MDRLRTLVLALLVVFVVFISGCVGNNAKPATDTATTATMPSDSGGVSGDIPSAEGGGVAVDTPASSSGENVDLGTLI